MFLSPPQIYLPVAAGLFIAVLLVTHRRIAAPRTRALVRGFVFGVLFGPAFVAGGHGAFLVMPGWAALKVMAGHPVVFSVLIFILVQCAIAALMMYGAERMFSRLRAAWLVPAPGVQVPDAVAQLPPMNWKPIIASAFVVAIGIVLVAFIVFLLPSGTSRLPRAPADSASKHVSTSIQWQEGLELVIEVNGSAAPPSVAPAPTGGTARIRVEGALPRRMALRVIHQPTGEAYVFSRERELEVPVKAGDEFMILWQIAPELGTAPPPAISVQAVEPGVE